MSENDENIPQNMLFIHENDAKDVETALKFVNEALKRPEYTMDYPILTVIKGVLEGMPWAPAGQRLLMKIINKSICETEKVTNPRRLRSFRDGLTE